MSWTKQTKTDETGYTGGWGAVPWGVSAWGSPSTSVWTKQSDVSDTWVVRGIKYDHIMNYDTDTPYNSGIEIEVWTKVADAS